MILLLLFEFVGTVSSCARIYEVCCSSIQKTDNVKPRFNNPDILYTEPKITIDSSCGSAQIDCTLPGLDSEVYYLIYTDGNGTVLNAKGSLTPIFNTSTADLSCSTGYQNKDVYLSCEQGCTFDVCGRVGDCSCSPINDAVANRRLKRQLDDAFYYTAATTHTTVYDDNCQNIKFFCDPVEPNRTFVGTKIQFYKEREFGMFYAYDSRTYNSSAPDLKCVDSNWNVNGTILNNVRVVCMAYFELARG